MNHVLYTSEQLVRSAEIWLMELPITIYGRCDVVSMNLLTYQSTELESP